MISYLKGAFTTTTAHWTLWTFILDVYAPWVVTILQATNSSSKLYIQSTKSLTERLWVAIQWAVVVLNAPNVDI